MNYVYHTSLSLILMMSLGEIYDRGDSLALCLRYIRLVTTLPPNTLVVAVIVYFESWLHLILGTEMCCACFMNRF